MNDPVGYVNEIALQSMLKKKHFSIPLHQRPTESITIALFTHKDDMDNPAWWRGNDRGVQGTISVLNQILDKGEHHGTFGDPELEKFANRILELALFERTLNDRS